MSTRSTRAIARGEARTDRPTLICCKTIIGKGAPNRAGTAKAHGAALGDKEVAATREALGWPYAPFVIPEEVYAGWDAQGARRDARSGVERAVRRVRASASRS